MRFLMAEMIFIGGEALWNRKAPLQSETGL